MKQVLILSGKGGTGKTTVASAIIDFDKIEACADCDVDAPNLHLVLSQTSTPVTSDYYGFQKSVIDNETCIHCGLCEKHCAFDAIKNEAVDLYACEGCGVCEAVCPVKAVKLIDYSSGKLTLYKSDNQIFSTAQLRMGSGASGKLVAEVKKQLINEAIDKKVAIIDGSPGIGCPVIASVTGVDLIVMVAEPTISGIHDLERIMETVNHFGLMHVVLINKFDVNLENTKKIEDYCKLNGISVFGKIPYDNTVVKAVNSNKSIASYPKSPAALAINEAWNKIKKILI